MRRRFSYANVAATLALVFSMTGGAMAAAHYVINSTKQINPKVLKTLAGKAGAAGAAGTAGREGPKGERGPQGERGQQGLQGEKGETGPTHAYSAEGSAGNASVDVPAGSYAVSGDGTFYNPGPEDGAGECFIEAAGSSWDHQNATVPFEGEEEKKSKEKSGSAGIGTQATVKLSVAGAIAVRCQVPHESKQGVGIGEARIMAIEVGAVN